MVYFFSVFIFVPPLPLLKGWRWSTHRGTTSFGLFVVEPGLDFKIYTIIKKVGIVRKTREKKHSGDNCRENNLHSDTLPGATIDEKAAKAQYLDCQV